MLSSARLATFVLCLCLAGACWSAPASADCRVWQIDRSEGEEGPELVAQICAGPEPRDPQIIVRCSGPNQLNLRFLPGDDGDHSGARRDFLLRADQRRRPVFLAYEGLDGAFAGYLVDDHTVFEMMKSARSLQVSDPSGKVPTAMFTLNGARTALELLVKNCKR